MFKNGQEKLHHKLVNSRTFGNGNILLIYQPVIKVKGFWQRILQTFRSASKQPSEMRQ